MTEPLTLAQLGSELQRTQAALAASQADLTRVEAERDQFRSNYLRDAARLDQLDSDLVDMELDLADARAELASLRPLRAYVATLERALSIADAAHDRTRTELRKLRGDTETMRIQLAGVVQFACAYQAAEPSWQVADRDTGIACSSCTGPIVRGQAFQPLADAKGFFSHVACPIREADRG